MQLSTTTAATTVNNACGVRPYGANFALSTLVGVALLTACGAKPLDAPDVDLRLAGDPNALVLTVANRSGESLDLPADLVNGPRSTRSIFLKVRDERGMDLKRCAIVELEPERMRNIRVSPGEEKVVDIPLQTLAATYCVQKMKVVAVYGSLADGDQVLPITSSNEVDISKKGFKDN